jgi:hypothetical protein
MSLAKDRNPTVNNALAALLKVNLTQQIYAEGGLSVQMVLKHREAEGTFRDERPVVPDTMYQVHCNGELIASGRNFLDVMRSATAKA